MATDVTENTTLRLKAVLEVLAEALWADEKRNAGEVLAEALQRVPPNEKERELLSGGIPRGHKNLTSATAKLVKAGWLSKGKGGWAITDDGLRAIVTFREPGVFGSALAEGTPVPEDVPVPTKAPKGFLPKKAPAKRRARVVKEAAADASAVAAAEAVAPAPAAPVAAEAAPSEAAAQKPAVQKPARRRSRKASAATGAPAEAAVQTEEASTQQVAAEPVTEVLAQTEVPAKETIPQPAAVAVAGDFGKILGADEDWAPQYDEVQMKLDPADQLWKLTADLPAGYYQYKVALNRSWDENYGAFGIRDGANHELHHGGGEIRLRYDHRTKDVVTG